MIPPEEMEELRRRWAAARDHRNHAKFVPSCGVCYEGRLAELREQRRSEVRIDAAATELELRDLLARWKREALPMRERLPDRSASRGPLYPRSGLGYLGPLGEPCGVVELDFERVGWWPGRG